MTLHLVAGKASVALALVCCACDSTSPVQDPTVITTLLAHIMLLQELSISIRVQSHISAAALYGYHAAEQTLGSWCMTPLHTDLAQTAMDRLLFNMTVQPHT